MSSLILNGVLQSALIGLEFLGPKPFRALGPLVADCVVEELHHDEVQISDHPVEDGASISDHAIKLPVECTLVYAWTASTFAGAGLFELGGGFSRLNGIYAQLIQLQNARTLLTVYTGRRVYQNMLVKAVVMEETKKTANSLVIRAQCREVLLVSTSTVQVPTTSNPNNMANPQDNAPTLDQGTLQLQQAPNANLGAITTSV